MRPSRSVSSLLVFFFFFLGFLIFQFFLVLLIWEWVVMRAEKENAAPVTLGRSREKKKEMEF